MATISIDLTAAQAQRVATAFGKAYGLGRDATAAEVRSYLITYMKGVVGDQEKATQVQTITVPDLGVT